MNQNECITSITTQREKRAKRERGGTLVEYAVLVVMITLLAVVSVKMFAEERVFAAYNRAGTALADAGGGGYPQEHEY